MAKKNKETVPNPSSVPNRDIIQRLNFLYQASTYLHELAQQNRPVPEVTEGFNEDAVQKEDIRMRESAVVGEKETPGRKRNKGRVNTGDLARSYVKSMKIIGQKTIVRMDPSVKRTLCKGCNTVLIPGVTAKVRVKHLSSHGHAVLYTCSHCLHQRQIPAPPILHEASSPTAFPPAVDDQNTEKRKIGGQPTDQVAEMLDISANESLKGPEKEQVCSKRKKKKPAKPRPVPFFERGGHALFVGNEVADTTSEAN